MNREFYELLGQRIRERRKELKLTQNAVCGDYMTRNMLSSIENGSAHPSLDTLLYIADRLNMPAEYFMSRDSSTAALYKRIESIDKIRELFETKQYRRCLDLCYEVQIPDSEIYLIMAESELKLAFDLLQLCKLRSAEVHLVNCEKALESTIYFPERYSATILFLRQLICSIRENQYPDVSFFRERRPILVDEEFLVFLFTLSTSVSNGKIPYSSVESVSNPIYKSFLSAEYYMLQGEYDEAKPYLHNICSSNPGFFTRYFSIQGLERCYKETDDYKSAYEFAKRRLDLIDIFNE